MAKKVAPKIVEETQTRLYQEDPLAHGLKIPGKSFRWIDVARRAHTRRMKNWTVVERDSELGQLVKEQMFGGHEKFAGSNESSNAFHCGTQLVLAWAPEEEVAAARAASSKKADDRLQQIVTKGTTLRERYVTEPPKK